MDVSIHPYPKTLYDADNDMEMAIENKKSYEKKTSSINSKIFAGTYSHLYAISTDANQVFGCSIESDETIRGQSCIIFDHEIVQISNNSWSVRLPLPQWFHILYFFHSNMVF